MKKYQLIVSILFFIILIFPTGMNVFSDQTIDEEKENRTMAKWPKFDLFHLDKYPGELAAYFDDHFGFRPQGLKLYNRFNYFFLKKSPVPDKAVLGKDYWLYKGTDIDIYRGKERMSVDELSKMEAVLTERNEYLKSKNCKLLIAITPMKKEIYPEFLPQEYFRYTNHTMTDQFIQLVENKTDIEIVDMRDILRDKKEKYFELYHKHDNHWNDIGAFFTYQEIIKHLSDDFDLGEADDISKYKIDTLEWKAGSLAKILGVDDVIEATRINMSPMFERSARLLAKKYPCPERFPYPWAYEKRYSNDEQSLPRLMMVNDSFGEYLYPFLAEHFSYSIFLFDSWEYKLHVDKLDEEKPDVFIISIVEPLIPNILKNMDRVENQIPRDEV